MAKAGRRLTMRLVVVPEAAARPAGAIPATRGRKRTDRKGDHMAGAAELGHYKDALIVLATAGVVVPVMHRLKVSPVIGYIAAGLLLGPNGLGALALVFPDVHHVTLGGVKDIAALAELGVVFLLFVIGLELSPERLVTMRRLVFGLGGLQVLLSALVIGASGLLFGNSMSASVLIGLSLALSSTAVVLEVMAQRKRLTSPAGRASFAVLLLQDLAVIPVLVLAALLIQGKGEALGLGIVMALAQAALMISLIVALGYFVLRPLFRLVAATQSPELFMASTLLVAIGSGVLAAAAGLSMALGGFIAGLLLAETEYRKAVESVIQPFKGLLLGVFFISVGLRVDLVTLFSDPVYLVGCAAGLVLIKVAIAYPLCRLFGLSAAASTEAALVLGAGGEFAFIVIAIAMSGGIVTDKAGTEILIVVAVTMTAIPWLASLGERIGERLAPPTPADGLPEDLAPPAGHDKVAAIVIGAGRVGRVVASLLAEHRIPYLVSDRIAVAVADLRADGYRAYWGDAKSEAFLRQLGIMDAKAVIVTMNAPREIDAIVATVRALRPDIEIVVRARDAEHARRLYAQGVTDAVPETIEASLQLSEASLAALAVPAGLAIASIHEKRDAFRRTLQAATTRERPVRGVRASAKSAQSRDG
ncbi:MAG: cation:proton antiporter [Hyphomicrobiaceae bacterium]